MTPDYRALCAELADALAEWRLGGGPPEDTADADLIDRARALLAQPVAEGPTDEEIEEWADTCPEAPLEEMDPEVHGWRRCFTAKEFSETIRAALDRWGRPAAAPVAIPGEEYHEDMGPVTWWRLPVDEPPWVGTPNDSDWPGYHTHFTPAPTNPLNAHALPTPEATND